ncbi:ShlB/FhaC/HecB family hemolysin secretion/activation protein [Polymorphobacter sp.]|uniref:ShlB/FhaC/HecB family hemolysin secretion/activation protein n=1 Tax=Polymorphobacter sp. TaxID=1909290 RepID=UPI003F70584A
MAGALLLGAAPALAQAPPLPSGAIPGRDVIEGQTTAPRREQRRVRVEGDIERSPCALSDPAYAAIRITPSRIVFNNLGPVDPAELEPLYARYLNSEQPVSVICEIRDAAATLLRARGYIAAVQVPAQRIENGEVRLEVLYAKVTAVRVMGDAGANARVFERYLARLSDGQVFNRFEAERWLLLSRDVPGHDVRLLLKPAGTGAGEMVAEIALERTPLMVDFSVQNLASEATGRWGGQVRAEAYGLTGMGDRTSLSFYTTPDFDEQMIFQIGHDFLVGGNGLRIGGRFTHAWSRPDLAGVPPILAQTAIAAVDARYPLIRRQGGSLGLTAGIEIVNQRVAFNALPLSRDRLRIGYLRLDGDLIDMAGVGPGGATGWRLSGALELRQGMDILSASPNCLETPLACTAAGALPPGLVFSDPTALLVRFQGRAELRLAEHLVISLSPRGQYSASALPSYETFALGNFTLGRGFDPGALTGDKGVALASEIAFPGLMLSARAQLLAEPYLFADAGWVWDRFAPVGAGARALGSVGGGVRTIWGEKMRLDAVVAVPTRTVGLRQAGDVRFLVTLTTRLWPWGNR